MARALAPPTQPLDVRLCMADHDKVLCVFGLIEVEPKRYAFGFAQACALPPEVSPSRVEDALRGPGAETIERLPLERA